MATPTPELTPAPTQFIEIGTTKLYLKHPLPIDGHEVSEITLKDKATRPATGAESAILTQRKKSKIEGKPGELVYKDKTNPGETYPMDESFAGLTYTTESGDRFRIDPREISLTPPTAAPETPAIPPEPIPKREVISIVGVQGQGREASRLAGEAMDRTKDIWKKTFQEYFEERRRQYYNKALEIAQTPFAEAAITQAQELAKQKWADELAGMNKLKRFARRAWDGLLDHTVGRNQVDEYSIQILADKRDELLKDAAKAFDTEKDAMAKRFESEFNRDDDVVRKNMGEQMLVFKPDSVEHQQMTTDIKNLINEYRIDTAPDADSKLQQKLHELYGRSMSTYAPEMMVEADQYASSLTAIAKDQRERLAHGEATGNLDAELANMEIRLAIGHMGTATELTPTSTHKWVERTRKVWETLQKKNIATAVAFNDTTVATGVSLFLAITKLPVRSVASWKARMLIGPAAGAGIGALMGGMREYRRRQLDLRRYWAQREANVVSPEDAKMRAWYERFDLKPRAVEDMTVKMTAGMYGPDGKTVKDSLTVAELRTSMAELADARARWDISAREKNRVGLINIGTIGQQEANRTRLSQTMVRVERDLKKYCADHAANGEVTALLGGATFDAFRDGIVKTQTSVLDKGRVALDALSSDSAMRLALQPMDGYAPEVAVFRRKLGLIGADRKTDKTVQGLENVLGEFRKQALVESTRTGAVRGAIGLGIGAVMNEAVVDVHDLAQYHTLTGTGAIGSLVKGAYEGVGRIAFHKDWADVQAGAVPFKVDDLHTVLMGHGMQLDNGGNLDVQVGTKVINNVIPNFKDHVTFTSGGMHLDQFAKDHLETAGLGHMITNSELLPRIDDNVMHTITIGGDSYVVPQALHTVSNTVGNTGEVKLVYDMVDEAHRKITVTLADHVRMTNGSLDASVLNTLSHRQDLFHVVNASHETVTGTVESTTVGHGTETLAAAPVGMREIHFQPGADANEPAGIGESGTWGWFQHHTSGEQFNQPTAAYDAMTKLERSWLLHQADPNKDITFDKVPGLESVTRTIPYHTTTQGNEIWLNAMPGNTVLHLPNSLFSDNSLAQIGHLSDKAVSMYQQKMAEGTMSPMEALGWVDKQDHALGILLKAGYFGREQDMPNNDELTYLMSHLGAGGGTAATVTETVAPRVVSRVIEHAGFITASGNGSVDMAVITVARDPAGYIPVIPVYPPPRRLEAVTQPLTPFAETIATPVPTPAPEVPPIAPRRLPRRRPPTVRPVPPEITPVAATITVPPLEAATVTIVRSDSGTALNNTLQDIKTVYPPVEQPTVNEIQLNIDRLAPGMTPGDEMEILDETLLMSLRAREGIVTRTALDRIATFENALHARMKTLHESGTAYPAGYVEPGEIPVQPPPTEISRSPSGTKLNEALENVKPFLSEQPDTLTALQTQVDRIRKGFTPENEMVVLNEMVATADTAAAAIADQTTREQFNFAFTAGIHRRMATLHSRGVNFPDGYTAPTLTEAPTPVAAPTLVAEITTGTGRTPFSTEFEQQILTGIDRVFSEEQYGQVQQTLSQITADKSNADQITDWTGLANTIHGMGANSPQGGAKQRRLFDAESKIREEIAKLVYTDPTPGPARLKGDFELLLNNIQTLSEPNTDFMRQLLASYPAELSSAQERTFVAAMRETLATQMDHEPDAKQKILLGTFRALTGPGNENYRMKLGIPSETPVAATNATSETRQAVRTSLSVEVEAKMMAGFDRAFSDADKQDLLNIIGSIRNGVSRAEQADRWQQVADKFQEIANALPEDNRRRMKMEPVEQRLRREIASLRSETAQPEVPVATETETQTTTTETGGTKLHPYAERITAAVSQQNGGEMSDTAITELNAALGEYKTDIEPQDELALLGRLHDIAENEAGPKNEAPKNRLAYILRENIEEYTKRFLEDNPQLAASRVTMTKVAEVAAPAPKETTAKPPFYEQLEKRIGKAKYAPGDREKILELVKGLQQLSPAEELEAIKKASEVIGEMQLVAPPDINRSAYVRTIGTLTTRWEELAEGLKTGAISETATPPTPTVTPTPTQTPTPVIEATLPPTEVPLPPQETPVETTTKTPKTAEQWVATIYKRKDINNLPADTKNRVNVWFAKMRTNPSGPEELEFLKEGSALMNELLVGAKPAHEQVYNKLLNSISERQEELASQPPTEQAAPIEEAAKTAVPTIEPTLQTVTETQGTIAPVIEQPVKDTLASTATEATVVEKKKKKKKTVATVVEGTIPTLQDVADIKASIEVGMQERELIDTTHKELDAAITALQHVTAQTKERWADQLNILESPNPTLRTMEMNHLRETVEAQINSLIHDQAATLDDPRVTELEKVVDLIEKIAPKPEPGEASSEGVTP